MSAVIKIHLKNAREALDRKDYITARDFSQQVLEIDPENYGALVFVGLCEQNLTRYVESEKAYLKAIQVNSTMPLAYQVFPT